MRATASSLVRVKKRTRSTLPPEQRTFSRLQKKIEALQKKERVLVRDLDGALQFYHGNISPIEQALLDLIMERVRIAYQFYKNGMKMSHSEKRAFKELIADDIEEILERSSVVDLPEDIREIFKDLHGFDYKDVASEELRDMKSEFQEMFKEMGVDIDLSGIDVSDTEEEILQKLFQSASAAVKEKMDSSSSEKKTQKQMKRELRQREIEETQKKSVNSIFRQLAKALHPDLESDSEKKSEKEALMKQVTEAYEKQDLHALLALELMWINGLSHATHTRNSEQLKIYNEILKDQVEALQARVNFLWHSPKYYPLRRFYPGFFEGTWVLHKVHRDLYRAEKDFRQLVEQLRTPAAESILRQAVQSKTAVNTVIRL